MKFTKLILSSIGAALCVAAAAQAADTRTVTFESRYNKKIKGAVCQVAVAGQSFEIVTPARVKLPLDASGHLNIEKMSCDLQGIKRSTDFFPDEVQFDREIHGISIHFKDKNPAFSYLKKNGGLAVWYTRDGKWVPVR